MSIGDLIDRGAVLVRAGAADKRKVLHTLADLAGRNFGLPASACLKALQERELLGSTGLGGGIALPHARLAGVERVRAVFLKLERPVAFDAVDGRPVDLFLALFSPPQAEPEHLRALAAASRLLRGRGVVERLRAAHSPDALRAILTGEIQSTAA